LAEFVEMGAEAEAGDALVELDTGAAGLETLEEAEQATSEEEALPELGDFVGREFAPTGGDGRSGAEAVEQDFDFSEGEIHFASEANEQEAVEGVGGIAALAAVAVGGWQEADAFVVANGGRGEAGLRGELADFHGRTFPRELTADER
jgi:hypothetical protein